MGKCKEAGSLRGERAPVGSAAPGGVCAKLPSLDSGGLYKHRHLGQAGRVIPEGGASIKHSGSVGVQPEVPLSWQVDVPPCLSLLCYRSNQDLQGKRKRQKKGLQQGED